MKKKIDEQMKYKKGDLFIGSQDDNKGTVLLAIEDTRSGVSDVTLCRFMNCPDETDKVGSTAYLASWALRVFYDKVE